VLPLKGTARSASTTGLVTAVHPMPPSVLRRQVPLSPTAIHVSASLNATP
jgi:hypothetical protein